MSEVIIIIKRMELKVIDVVKDFQSDYQNLEFTIVTAPETISVPQVRATREIWTGGVPVMKMFDRSPRAYMNFAKGDKVLVIKANYEDFDTHYFARIAEDRSLLPWYTLSVYSDGMTLGDTLTKLGAINWSKPE